MVSPKPWRLEPLLRMVLLLVICIVAGSFVAGLLRHWLGAKAVEDDMLSLILSIVCLHGAALVAIALFLRQHQISWAEAFGFKHEVGWAFVLGFFVAVIAVPSCVWLNGEMAQLLARLGFNVDEQEAVKLLRIADSLWKQVVLGVFAIIIAPVVEEMFFRGILYPLIKQKGHPILALWGTALLFALIHGNIVVIVPLAVLALVLTLLYEWTDNLLTCIVVHSLFNAANFVMLFAQKYSWSLPGN